MTKPQEMLKNKHELVQLDCGNKSNSLQKIFSWSAFKRLDKAEYIYNNLCTIIIKILKLVNSPVNQKNKD